MFQAKVFVFAFVDPDAGALVGHNVYLFIARAAEISEEKNTQGIDPVSWNVELQVAGLAYDGKEVSRPARLTLVQIRAGLLPAGVGASVDVLCVCTEEVRRMLEPPGLCKLPRDEVKPAARRARVRCTGSEWEEAFHHLSELGLLEPLCDQGVKNGAGGMVLNGRFGVKKPNNFMNDQPSSATQ
eukprot:7524826-Karenia_brevis.AAC.1